MLKKFLMKHYGLVELNELEKQFIKIGYNKENKKGNIAYIHRLSALGISYTYNKRTGIK